MGETINFTITNNTILGGKKGIVIASAEDGLVQFNQIQGNHIGIILFLGSGFIIEKNNFVRNVVDDIFYSQLIQRRNRWIHNYWGPLPKVVKPIFGLIQITFPVGDYSFLGIIVPWIKFDWSPAKEPYNIPGVKQ